MKTSPAEQSELLAENERLRRAVCVNLWNYLAAAEKREESILQTIEEGTKAVRETVEMLEALKGAAARGEYTPPPKQS